MKKSTEVELVPAVLVVGSIALALVSGWAWIRCYEIVSLKKILPF